MDAETLLNPAFVGSAVAGLAGVGSKLVAHWLERKRKLQTTEATMSVKKFDDAVAMREELWERIRQLEGMLKTCQDDLRHCHELLVEVRKAQ